MKKLFLFFIAALFVANTMAQQNFNDSIALARNKLTKGAMITLGSWSVANITSGFIIAGHTRGEAKYAWRMNGFWNILNLGIAGMGYAVARRTVIKQTNFPGNYKGQQAIEKLYLFNAGLDIAYIAGGFYLREKGKTEAGTDKRDQLKGYGTSIAIQGGFLLLMDAVMFGLHHKNTNRMNKKWGQVEVNAGPGGLGVSYVF
jgi:hypothetical protein